MTRPPRPWNPKIVVDEQTKLAISALARPYLGKVRRSGKVCRAVQQMLADKFSAHAIVVRDTSSIIHRTAMEMHLLVIVDGEPDQGIVIGQRKPDGSIYGIPANG